MKWNRIFKRKKTSLVKPEPIIEDDWLGMHYEQNLKQGVESLKKGQEVRIIDDGRGYELALDIKEQFILEYQRWLSEKIKIIDGSTIIVRVSSM